MLKETKKLICIVCPAGCRLKCFEADGELKIEGNLCPKGAEYALAELTNPMRVLTTTIALHGEPHRRLAVRTTAPIHKKYIFPALEVIKKLEFKTPVKRGQVLLSNICNTGVDVVASCDLY